MTDYIIIITLAAFWAGVAVWLNAAERREEKESDRVAGVRFANWKED